MEERRALDQAECVALLRRRRLGRIAVTDRALPVIVPVSYALDGRTVVFRTRPDGMLARACRSAVVAFEVDDIADGEQGGATVLVVGVADVLESSEQLRALGLALLSPVADVADVFVGITPGSITGRRVGSTDATAARTG
jgi:nitroimidazol reductase NimA-like FMN-containing flavoprotein (pyridoxamine 5'-phosphate oxidase superfamily)